MSRSQAQALVFTGLIWMKTLALKDYYSANTPRKAPNLLSDGCRRGVTAQPDLTPGPFPTMEGERASPLSL